ncbi:MAG: 3-hydroxyacyl-CoA dehydrogenase family protein [bacterium]|nr:3-hydroxyacyl-CoA dehydrogenase family protein [bacterium]
MDLDNRLENVTIIGAAGKMGSGIAVLIGQEIAKLKIKTPDKTYKLNLIDTNEKALNGLYAYIKSQFVKVAEKSIVSLRSMYQERADLVENKDIIDAFVEDALGAIRFGNNLEMANNSRLVFEAIIENEDVKISLLKKLNQICSKDAFFFTNTSSIPISFLDKNVGLDGRIIGYHFYNPPVVQKLLEVISGDTTLPEIKDTAKELGERLRKKLLPANDIAGFIGNGYFMRDGLYGIEEVNNLKSSHTFSESIYMINRVTQDFLIRPMGIFQLIDYVGIEVFQWILLVMNKHLKDVTLHNKLIDLMVEKKVLGGQNSDGSQKNGFFSYKKNKMIGVYDIEKGEYMPIEEKWKENMDGKLGSLPAGFATWKSLLSAEDKDNLLKTYFNNLKSDNTLGAKTAKKYLERSKEIGKELVKTKVAFSDEDVNTVLTNGFFWLYGPINSYI